MNREELAQEIKGAVEWLAERECGCITIELDDRLAVCVGFSDGWDEDEADYIHSNENPSWCICAGLKVHTSDSIQTDFDFMNFPYTDDYVWDTGIAIAPEQDYISLAEWFLSEFEELAGYTISKNGRVEDAE